MPGYITANANAQAHVGVLFEPRRLDNKLRPMLQGQMHDALWMLTQQLKMREFVAQDAGTAVEARFELNTQKIAKFVDRNGTESNYNHEVPLETQVEKLPLQFNLGLRILFARVIYKLLDQHVPVNDFPTVLSDIKTNYPLTISKEDLSDSYAMDVVTPLDKYNFDGGKIYENVLTNTFSLSGAWKPAFENGLKAWVDATYQTSDNTTSNWNPATLEYQTKLAAPDLYETDNQVLTSQEYASGRLDWFSYDKGSGSEVTTSLTPDSSQVIAKVPSSITFPGMPHLRWWQYEDNQIDLANVFTQTKDVIKISALEYANVYSNDWMMIPIEHKVSSLSRINAIVVKDVFGVKTVIKPTRANHSNKAWDDWSLFNYNDSGSLDSKDVHNLFLAPRLPQLQESDPIEKIEFLRDEMANMVWGIEKIVPGVMSNGVDGFEAWNRYNSYLLQNLDVEVRRMYFKDNFAELSYELMNAFPENWIPFVPVNLGTTVAPDVHFQRATYHRVVPTEPPLTLDEYVAPRTKMLKPDSNAFYINEEEIQRAGIVLTSTFQRARWHDGSVHLWMGNKKSLGHGESSSDLRFDRLNDKRDYSEFSHTEHVYDVFHNFRFGSVDANPTYGNVVTMESDYWYPNSPGNNISVVSSGDDKVVKVVASATDERSLFLDKLLVPGTTYQTAVDLSFDVGAMNMTFKMEYKDFDSNWQTLFETTNASEGANEFEFELPMDGDGTVKVTLESDVFGPSVEYFVNSFKLGHESVVEPSAFDGVTVNIESLSFDDIHSVMIESLQTQGGALVAFADFFTGQLGWPSGYPSSTSILKSAMLNAGKNKQFLHNYSVATTLSNNSNQLYNDVIVNGLFPASKFVYNAILVEFAASATVASAISTVHTTLFTNNGPNLIQHCYEYDKRRYLTELYSADQTTFDALLPSGASYQDVEEGVALILGNDQTVVISSLTSMILESVNLAILMAYQDTTEFGEDHVLVYLFGDYTSVKTELDTALNGSNDLLNGIADNFREIAWNSLVDNTLDEGLAYIDAFELSDAVTFVKNTIKVNSSATADVCDLQFPNPEDKGLYLDQIVAHFGQDFVADLKIRMKKKYLK